jgi:hypothetical protein
MNQRDDTQGNEHVERGREANGGRDFYPGSHGFDEAHDRAYSQGAAGREAERWNNGFERSRHEQQHRGSWDAGRGAGWDAGRGRDWDAGRGGSRDAARAGGWNAGRGRGWDTGRGYGGGGGDYGPRAYWSDRPSWQDQYGFGQHTHWHDPLFDRRPFGPPEDTHYYGTGAAGWGGPGFTGGAYAYGNGPRDDVRQLEDEYSDESAVSYEQPPRQQYSQQSGQRYGQQYGRQYGPRYGYQPRTRRFTTGPKGYQRSDERLKEDICERLMELHHIDSSDVSVEVRGARVVLEGTVPSRHMKHAIEDLVDACPGVQDIDNRVRVTNPNLRQGQGAHSQGGQSQSLTAASASSGSSSGIGTGSGAGALGGTNTPNGTKLRS